MATLATLLGSTVLFTIAKTEEEPERSVPAIITGVSEEDGTVDLIVFDAEAKRPPSGIIDPARRAVTLVESATAGCASPLPKPVDESVVPETASKSTAKKGA